MLMPSRTACSACAQSVSSAVSLPAAPSTAGQVMSSVSDLKSAAPCGGAALCNPRHCRQINKIDLVGFDKEHASTREGRGGPVAVAIDPPRTLSLYSNLRCGLPLKGGTTSWTVLLRTDWYTGPSLLEILETPAGRR